MKTITSNLKLGICGWGRAGKDTAAEHLALVTPLVYTAGTSYWARFLVFDHYQKTHPGRYANPDECWHDRHNNRDEWAEIIGQYNRDDPVKLYRDCLEEQNFLTGVRWLHEQRALKQADLCDLWIWIENKRVKRDQTCQITAEDCDITILNNSTPEDFRRRLERFARGLKI